MRFQDKLRLSYVIAVCGVMLAVAIGGAIYAHAQPAASTSSYQAAHGSSTQGWTPSSAGGPNSTSGSPAPDGSGLPTRTGGTPGALTPSASPVIEGGHVPGQDPLTTLANALTVQAKSVSTLVTAPAGIPVTGPVSISILYPDNYRSTQAYEPASGNRFLYNLPEGDGTRLDEKLTVSLAEHGPNGTVLAAVYLPVTIEPRYDVNVSPITFTLISDCDIIGSSEPTILWADDRGSFEEDLDLSAGDTTVVSRFARTMVSVGVADNLEKPYMSWYDQDPGDFIGHPSTGIGPLLPGSGSTVDYTSQAQQGGPCLAEIRYSVTIKLLTYLLQ